MRITCSLPGLVTVSGSVWELVLLRLDLFRGVLVCPLQWLLFVLYLLTFTHSVIHFTDNRRIWAFRHSGHIPWVTPSLPSFQQNQQSMQIQTSACTSVSLASAILDGRVQHTSSAARTLPHFAHRSRMFFEHQLHTRRILLFPFQIECAFVVGLGRYRIRFCRFTDLLKQPRFELCDRFFGGRNLRSLQPCDAHPDVRSYPPQLPWKGCELSETLIVNSNGLT